MGRLVVIRANDIAGSSVRNPQGDEIGSIKDVMIDINDGCIACTALSFSGFMGLGEKIYAVPWEALEYNASDNAFILNVPIERLEKGPCFEGETWPKTADREWLAGMYTHFGVNPPWERGIER
ncbi:MAG: PRC-barrel domain-containing protein [Methanomicrobiaceae archaeon]|nr:PRC-barrel domain-containing protein [Methanomicrobiaceae archaeon]